MPARLKPAGPSSETPHRLTCPRLAEPRLMSVAADPEGGHSVTNSTDPARLVTDDSVSALDPARHRRL